MDKLEKWIRIRVDSTGVKKGVDSARAQLKKFGNAAKKEGSKASKAMKKFRDSFGGIAGKIAAIGAAFSGMQILKFADELTLVESRIRRFVSSEEELIEVQARLRASAKQTFTEYTEVANLYSRLSTVTQELGFTQDQIIGIGTGLAQTFRLSGANAQEAAASVIQLTQGLGSGALRGDEFRAIQEGNVVLLQLLAKELGVATGELKAMSTQGKITSDVIANALIKNLGTLNEEAGKLATTSGQAMQVLKTEVGEVVELFNKVTEATENSSNLILRISEIISDNQKEIVTFASGLKIFFEGVVKFFQKTAMIVNRIIEEPTEVFKGMLRSLLGYLESFARIIDKHTPIPWMDKVASGFEQWKKELGPVTEYTREYAREMDELDMIAQKNVLTILAERDAMHELIDKRREAAKKGNKPEAVGDVRTDLKKYNDALDTHIEKLKSTDPAFAKYVENFRKMQIKLEDGVLSQEEFDAALTKSAFAFSKVEQASKQYSKEMQEYLDKMNLLAPSFASFVVDVRELQTALSDGNITQQQFTSRVRELNEELTGNTPVMKAYVEEIKDSIDGFSRDASQSFADFVTKGKVDFKDFANSIINDLIRMSAQKLVFDQAFGAIGTGLDNISGNSGGITKKRAKGGLIERPTIIPSAQGNVLAGEAGTEAIMPLKRTRSGNLGIISEGGGGARVTVNVNNQVEGAQATVEESDDGMGGSDIRILFTQMEDHMANRVSKRQGNFFGALQQGGFQGRLR